MSAARSALLPDTALSDTRALAEQLSAQLSPSALQWLSGYLAGAAAHKRPLDADSSASDSLPVTSTATVLYGSQTGNAKRAAEQLAQRLGAEGVAVNLHRTDAYPVRQLKQETQLYVVISTQGEGEPPDDARAFMDFLMSRRAPKLPELRYAVLALGDSSYPDFCVIGRRIDARLSELGATAMHPRGEADVDIETVAEPWLDAVLAQARQQTGAAQTTPLASVTPLRTATPSRHSRERPFAAEVLGNQRISGRDSLSEVRHIELSLEGSGLAYAPGDAIGVWPRQSPALVEAVLQGTGLDGDTQVEHKGERLALADWLGQRRELTRLTRPLLAAQAERGDHAALKQMLGPDQRDALARTLDEWQLLDLLQHHPAEWDAPALVAALRPLAPRMYSIASSPLMHEDEAHLTVAHLQRGHGAAARWGVASRFLSQVEEGAQVPVFIESNERFRLPADDGRDIIMIGPGTGVAPFRAFVQQRQLTAARGRQWLFFGHRHRRDDFLYQNEWLAAHQAGALKLDVAFSRDQTDKLYVQQRMSEHGAALYDWIENGAHVYVCGDALRMARDVHATLLAIAQRHGSKSTEDAHAWLDALAADGRYARDVY
ncbi:assimilatory sulfite reductase (NADPH) flavoprotein subunit [Oleiagrimonas sp. C23AA]|uniref:assimilatory sulfite reductase (NADPH) flavoprotein subunit n=1 Tax=Oleiagrimonas sp. C23AA TaxID=2719047 RepID=UPI0014235457|nr:assimilatory sulfite reductase (NADPH) flavoprotein subunit [Oleiagrimonas sp. C23AA]NII11499.1 assimilatory sulfite reductase (NADPH) flavoprotein subunit [Oleiagrimonas sp. C23AA]